MKKNTGLFLLCFNTLGLLAQTNQQTLLTNTWYLSKIEVNNEIMFPPFTESTESSILQFLNENESYTFTQNQCVNEAQGSIASLNEMSLQLDNLDVTLAVCPNINLELFFATLNTNVFWNNSEYDFQYTITSENDLLQLEITGANGNKAFYYNNAMANTKSFNGELLKVYPNPTSAFLNISIPDLDNVEIFDMLGKRILPTYNSTESATQIDIQNLAKGNYILKISKENQTENIKFIKE